MKKLLSLLLCLSLCCLAACSRRTEEIPAEESAPPAPEENPTELLRARYDELATQKEEQQALIAANKGWFGEAAKRRKAAQALLEELEQTISTEFPNGRP